MYCSNCGAEASGNFCAKCGAPLKGEAPPPPPQDWSDEVRYEVLMRIPEVRDRIARAAATRPKRVSAEQFLDIADKLIALGVKTIPLKSIADVAVPIFVQIGIKTAKTRSETIAVAPGKAIVAALCAFAGEGQDLKQVQQLENGCLFEAAIPSDLFSWEGSLFVTLRRASPGTRVDAATSIGGQLYDWGKSARCLERLFAALKAPAA
jgi:hypothetical protein